MKNKKMFVGMSAVLILIIIVFSVVLKADGSKVKTNNDVFMSMISADTLKPEAIREKRITKVEVINGKKKIFEKIIKMRGDSIIEEKTVEKEEDLSDNPGINQDFHIQSFDFNTMDLDSLLGMRFDNFGIDPFSEDSLFQKRFGFSFNPGFHMGYGDSFMEDDFFKNFFQNMEVPNINKHMEDFLQNHIPKGAIPNDRQGFAPVKKFKSLKEIIRDKLLNDGFIKGVDDNFSFDINEKKLKINGEKQSIDVYNRYKKVIEENLGMNLEGEFEYNFKNSKSLQSGMRKI